MEAAIQEFHEKGYDAATMRGIAARIGIRAPSIYNYVATKEELLFEVMRLILIDLLEELREADKVSARQTANLRLRLRSLLRAFALYNIKNSARAAVSNSELSSLSPELRNEVITLRNSITTTVSSLIEEGVENGDFKCEEPTVIARVILISLARIYTWFQPQGRRREEEIANLLADYFVSGLAAPERVGD